MLAEQYTIEARIGRGCMGTVYRGVQLSVNRPAAIKLIAHRIAGDLEVVKRFQREAQLTSRLEHPNSIRLYDFGVTDDGALFLVMELLRGRELEVEMRERGALALERAVNITVQVLRALREAHLRPRGAKGQAQGQGELFMSAVDSPRCDRARRATHPGLCATPD